MHVSNKRGNRSRVLLWCAGLVAICAQASSFFSCSFGTSGSLPVLPPTVSPPPPPSITISVTPTTIVLGQSAVLSWSSSGIAGGCTASGAWSGQQNPAGSTKVTPATTGVFSYVLTCAIAPAGSVAQSATLTVNAMAAPSQVHVVATSGRARLVLTDLVADVPGTSAAHADPNLIEPWGLVLADERPAVVAIHGSNRSSSYDGAGSSQSGAVPLRVQLPARPGGAAFGATGVVANSSDGFVVAAGGRSAAARLIYAGTGGMIAGWSPEVDGTNAVTAYAAADGASYTSLAVAISSSPGESHLYAADFRNGKVDVFDSSFRLQTRSPTRFAFTDTALPSGYSPFGIAPIGDLIYIAYAQRRGSSGIDPVSGAGLGLVDVFTMSGDFITRLIASGGALNAPWAIVRAPDDAAAFAGALLVADTGDGKIDAFDSVTGSLLGFLSDEKGAALVVPRLHGLAFGNDSALQPRTALFFSAGAHAGARGWYGRIDFAPAPQSAP
jgi:uncharacterized protein (TIGR03118 family)